jgi:hypothetical protein
VRRPLLLLFAFAAAAFIGCGIDAVASKTFDGAADGGNDGNPNLPPKGDGGDLDAPATDAPVDAPVESGPVRPDAGVVFVPSHIQPVYSLTAGAVVVNSASFVDTKNRTIALNGASPVVSPDIVFSDGVAVWSVDSLTTNARLTITGDRPLVIVALHDVVINFTVSAFGTGATPGPGGAAPGVGAGKGGNGTKTGNDASGGGGAGHGTPGNAGGDKAAVTGGVLGPLTNGNGALLIGGSGGGNGGGYAAGVCGGRGRGGAGGGALQISAVGSIVINSNGGIDVGGGGGGGGCKDNGGDKYSGGGGGGAGGLVYLESVAGITVTIGGTIEASGGGGGEGGDSNSFGNDGDDGPYPIGTAAGGFGTNGGNGGSGGNVSGSALPQRGSDGADTGGGGGGATGRVFLRTRGATLDVMGIISAQRTDDATF